MHSFAFAAGRALFPFFPPSASSPSLSPAMSAPPALISGMWASCATCSLPVSTLTAVPSPVALTSLPLALVLLDPSVTFTLPCMACVTTSLIPGGVEGAFAGGCTSRTLPFTTTGSPPASSFDSVFDAESVPDM